MGLSEGRPLARWTWDTEAGAGWLAAAAAAGWQEVPAACTDQGPLHPGSLGPGVGAHVLLEAEVLGGPPSLRP